MAAKRTFRGMVKLKNGTAVWYRNISNPEIFLDRMVEKFKPVAVFFYENKKGGSYVGYWNMQSDTISITWK